MRAGRCLHCGLAVPRGSRHAEFCCSGCAAVHALLSDGGLKRFYELGGARARPVGPVPRVGRHDWLEELEEQSHVLDGLVSMELDVQGLRCAACVWLLQEIWRRRDGALDIRINPSLGQMRLTYDRTRLRLGDFLDEAAALGYPTAPASKHASREDRSLLIRLGICTALAMNAMILALAGYLGLDASAGDLRQLFDYLSLAFASLAVLVGGPVFFRRALAGVRARVLHLDLPISVGIALAWIGSTLVFLGGGAGYFDTVTVFVALMLAGRYLQQRAVLRSREYLLANDGSEHLRARRLVESRIQTVRLDELRPGDELLLAPGDLVPVRAELLGPDEPFSLDWISGESEPRQFTIGEQLPAGAFHAGRRQARARALMTAQASGLTDLLRAPMDDREAVRGHGTFWNRLNQAYVAAVLILAAVGAGLWLLVDPSRSLLVATSILVVTCPCALGLATPLAFHLVLAGLRRRGVFVRTANFLEKARHVRKVLFDKTGTLTWGGLRARPAQVPEGDLRDVMLTLAGSSGHPVSQAIASELAASGFHFRRDLQTIETVGCGVEGRRNGDVYRLGSPDFATGNPRGPGDAARNLCIFSHNGTVAGRFAIEEDFRSGAAEEIRDLAMAGVAVFLLSGDRPEKVRAAAARLGVPPERAFGDMSSADKASLVQTLDRDDTLMVGDGLNDAAAFSAAYCAATPALDRPVMPARADFFFVGAKAGAIHDVLQRTDRLHRVVRTNLWLAGAYNSVALTLCFLGVMTPLLCAVLMPASSIALLAHTFTRLARDATSRDGTRTKTPLPTNGTPR